MNHYPPGPYSPPDKEEARQRFAPGISNPEARETQYNDNNALQRNVMPVGSVTANGGFGLPSDSSLTSPWQFPGFWQFYQQMQPQFHRHQGAWQQNMPNTQQYSSNQSYAEMAASDGRRKLWPEDVIML